MYLFHFVLHLFQVLFNVLSLSWELLKEKKHPDVRWTAICNNVLFFFLFHTFLLTLTFISLIWGFLSYHCLLPLLVAFWDLGAAMRVRGKKASATHTTTQLWGQGCQELCHLLNIRVLVLDFSEENIFYYKLHNPLHHVAAVAFLCMKVRGHVRSRQDRKCCRGVQRADSSCKAYPDVNKELLPNQSVVRVLVWRTGLRGKKEVSGDDGNLT